MTISRSVPENIRPPERGIFALGILADDHEIDAARRPAGEGRPHTREESDCAQIDVPIEFATDQKQWLPERYVIGNDGQPTAPKIASAPASGAFQSGEIR